MIWHSSRRTFSPPHYEVDYIFISVRFERAYASREVSMKILLLLLGWAMIGRGMWYRKGGVPKNKQEKHTKVAEFKNRLAYCGDEILFALSQDQSQAMLSYFEQQAAIKRLRRMHPRASIKIKLNTTDSAIPDCHYPHRIIYKYTHPADQITKFVFCSLSKRVYTLARMRENIAITFNVCANEQMCIESYLQQGFVKKLDDRLAVVPPRFDDRYVNCCIEHPADKEFELVTRDLPEFLKSVEQEGPEDDSFDLDLSDGPEASD